VIKTLVDIFKRILGFFDSPQLAFWFVFLFGVVNLWSTIFPARHLVFLVYFESFAPWLEGATRLFLIFSGISLIYLSFGLIRRRKIAWLTIEIVLISTTIIHLFREFAPGPAAANFFFSLWLYGKRESFFGKISRVNIVSSLTILLFGLLTVVAYGSALFYFEQNRLGLGYSFFTGSLIVVRSLSAFRWIGPALNPGVIHWILISLPGAFSLVILYTLYLLFRTIANPRGEDEEDWLIARKIINRWGKSTTDCFKLWPANTRFIFGPNEKSLVAYIALGNNLLVAGDVVGSIKSWRPTLKRFLKYCQDYGKNPLIIGAGKEMAVVAKKFGMKAAYIADEALVDLKKDPYAIKDLRNTAVKLKERRGYRFEMWLPPLDERKLSDLKKISDDWLLSLKRKDLELVFGGGWVEAMVKNSLAGVIKDQSDQPIAMATIINGYAVKTAELDLMRRCRKAENGTTELLFAEMCRWLESKNWRWLDLGGAPREGAAFKIFPQRKTFALLPRRLASLQTWRRLPGNVLAQARKVSPKKAAAGIGKIYFDVIAGLVGDYKGLRYFKAKFRPTWEPRYLIYRNIGDLVYLLSSWPFIKRKPLSGDSLREFYYQFLLERNKKIFRGEEKQLGS